MAYAANLAFKKDSLKKVGGYPKHLTELGDQQYLLFKFFHLGEVKIDPKVYCKTSARKLNFIWRNLLLFNGWHRIIGYIVNRLMGKEVIGPAPAVRKEASNLNKAMLGKRDRNTYPYRLKRIS